MKPAYREHLDRTFRLGTTPNGVFGSKLMWSQIAELHALAGELSEFAGLDAFELLQKLFDGPTFIHVTRRDKVRQAVSLWRALQTRSWRREHAPGDDLSDDWTAAYHRDAARERVGAGAALSTT